MNEGNSDIKNMSKELTTKNLNNDFLNLKCCVIIPTYNNYLTIKQVIQDVLKYTDQIIVVNDGSTDETSNILKEFIDINIISYVKNKGKGMALRVAFKEAAKLGYDYAITIDSDGQHFADDIPVFIKRIKEEPDLLIVGSRNMDQESVPGKSSFGHKFSNFWFKFETDIDLPDTQSGFRLYPLMRLKGTKFFTRKYEFEIEIIVRAAWKGIKVVPVPIKVYYAPKEERVSHFRPFKDFSRVSVLNVFLVFITLLIIKPMNLFRYFKKNSFKTIIKEQVIKSNDSNIKISSAFAFGVFMGIIPLWGFQLVIAIFISHLLKLNKIIVVFMAHISIPPMIPFILYFSYKCGGLFYSNKYEQLTLDSFKNAFNGDIDHFLGSLGNSVIQYVTGGVFLSIAMAIITWGIAYLTINSFSKKRA